MKQKIYILSFFAIVLSISSIQGQQSAQYSLYMLNQHNFNPAYTGMEQSLSATGQFRKQWLGFPGSPTTQNVNIHSPVLFLGSAFGMKLENDVLGAEKNITAMLSYAYQKELGAGNILSIGLEGGIVQKTLDGTMLNPPDLDQPDKLIPIGVETAIAPTAGVGVYFMNDRVKAGVSANNILETSFPYSFTDNNGIKLKRNYFAIFAYNFEIGDILLEPSTLIKSDLVQTQIDFSVVGYYNDNIFGGASFRGYNKNTFDAVVLLAGLKVSENVTFAYAYDISLFQLSGFNNGSHEIILNYNLGKSVGKPRPAKIIYNPKLIFD